jgi:aminoglycoside phosphotransferase (APT) family kinase protein
MSTAELSSAFETTLARPVRILRRTPSDYSSSFSIEELDVTFADGERMTMIFKNLSPDAILGGAREAKPDFLYAPEREIQVYRSLLSKMDSGAPKVYGAVTDPVLQRYWLFIEKVAGRPLREVGEFDLWLEAARWLARFHASADAAAARAAAPQLLEHDAEYYRLWLRRAHEVAGPSLDRIADRYDRVIEVLLALPRSLIHGEFYASNILVQERAGEIRVCPVDWEMAATGPGFCDVAALASGKWSRDDQLCLVDAYHSALPEHLRPRDFLLAFDCCQLHIALQWLGWSQSWEPPYAHAHDWLAEALRISTTEPVAALLGA